MLTNLMRWLRGPDLSAGEAATHAALTEALKGDELAVYYQPVVGMTRRSVVSIEALVRWRDPFRGIVAAREFIGTADKTDLATRLGERVLESVCSNLRGWLDDGLDPPPAAINLSARWASDPRLPQHIESALRAADVEPQLLELEVPDGALRGETDEVLVALRNARELGVSIAVDLFGTDLEWLERATTLDISGFKVDMESADADSERRALAERAVARAHELGLIVTGKNVATPDQLELLRTLGCDRMQGYLFAEPLPPIRLHELLVSVRTARHNPVSPLHPAA